jgi:hypothetical protein
MSIVANKLHNLFWYLLLTVGLVLVSTAIVTLTVDALEYETSGRCTECVLLNHLSHIN